MVESLWYDNIDRISDLQKDANKFEFHRSLFKSQELKNDELPEWFVYDSDGYIVCKKNIFTDEDYEQEEKPIDKILWWEK